MNTTTLNLNDKLIFEACKSAVFDWMEKEGVAQITLTFDGPGDDGCFSDYPNFDPIDISADNTDFYDRVSASAQSTVVGSEYGGVTIHALLKAVGEHVEETAGHDVDWVNNDGGQGSVQFILDGLSSSDVHYRRGIHLEVGQRVVEIEYEHHVICGAIEPDIIAQAEGPDVAAGDAADAGSAE